MAQREPLVQPDLGSGDDLVLPFRTVNSGVSGRLVRLGSAVDTILKRHDYGVPVSEALGEALILAAMLGSAQREEGRFVVQTKTDGPLKFLVADYETPGKVRGYASFAAGVPLSEVSQAELLGTGHLAMTVEQRGKPDRYQGIVSLAGEPLLAAAHAYFHNSEQLPTFVRAAVARHYARGQANAWHWRAGGLMIQKMFPSGERARPGDDETGVLGEHDEDWVRTRLLAETVEDHELSDPLLQPDRLLYQLFHEEGVVVMPTTRIEVHCRCSHDKVASVLRSFGPDQLTGMAEVDGQLTVSCEFCNTKYRFSPDEIGKLA